MLNKIHYVIKRAKFVKINQEILNKFISNIKLSDIYVSFNEDIFSVIEDYENDINSLFIFSCINFAFWSLDSECSIKEISSIKRSENIIKIFGSFLYNRKKILGKLLSEITLQQFANLLNKNFCLLINERWNNVRQAGLILNYRFNNSYLNLLKEANFDAKKALYLTIKYFPSFDDRFVYCGKEIEFHKRAQVLLSLISCIPNKLYKLNNINKLIGGADYKIPQLLRHLKILTYSKKLEKKVDNQELILSGSKEEIEIRAFTLWVINIIKNKLNRDSKKASNAMEIDNYLWRLSKKYKNMKPHHRTVSIYY